MAQRITKANVEARFQACARMAERCGIQTDTWHIWSQYDRQWCATDERGNGIFGSGGVFANGNRQAYDVMEGYLKAMQAVDAHLSATSLRALVAEQPRPVSPKHLRVYALPVEIPRTIDARA